MIPILVCLKIHTFYIVSLLYYCSVVFDQRFRSMESVLKESNREFSHMTERELDELWENVKEKE